MSPSEFWECEPIDVFIFLEERSGAVRDREQQEYDYVRRLMVAAMQPYSETPIKYTDVIRLDRDGPEVKELTPFERQELARWSAKCDEEMEANGMILVDWHGNPINKTNE